MAGGTAIIYLYGGIECLVDGSDYRQLSERKWHISTHGYAVTNRSIVGGKPRGSEFMHRFLTSAPPGTHVDHINGVKLDNRRANLRVVSPSRNQVNRKRPNRNNTTGVRGVTYRITRATTRPWRAQIMVDGRGIHIGSFDNIHDAIEARKAAEIAYYGEACP